jgi:hypothetical protein
MFWRSCLGQTAGRVVAWQKYEPGQGRGLQLSVLSHAALIFSCSGARVRIASLVTGLDPMALVELGLCCLDKQDKDNAALSGLVTLAEPLVVEAIIRAKQWGELAKQHVGACANDVSATECKKVDLFTL